MTTIDIKKSSLEACVSKAQSEKVLVTRKGTPVALVLGLEGLDKGQLELGKSDKFWKLVRARRKQKAVPRSVLEQISKGKGRQSK